MFGKLGRHVRQQFVGYLALFIALGGVSYAAVALPNNSVRSVTIKNGQVKGADLAENAVTAAKVKNGSLLGEDFASGQLPRGAQGPQGNTGPQGGAGPQGQTGPSGTQGERGLEGQAGRDGTNGTNGTNGTDGTNAATSIVVRKASSAVPVGETVVQDVFCASGQKATGGGVQLSGGNTGDAVLISRSGVRTAVFNPMTGTFVTFAADPVDGATPNAWRVQARNASGAEKTLTAYVHCASP